MPDAAKRRIARLKARIGSLATASQLASAKEICPSRHKATDKSAHRDTDSRARGKSVNSLCRRHQAPVARFRYKRRRPDKSVLHKVVRDNLAAFLQQAEQASGGLRFPRFVENELRDLATCGDFRRGLNLFRCQDCSAGKAVPFSCKSRVICPSCAAKRMTQLSAHLVDEVLPHAPIRLWVLSLPVWLRYRLAYDHELYLKVIAIFDRHVHTFYRQQAERDGIDNGQTGSVHFQQVGGGSGNVNPHTHSPYIEGVFYELENKEGNPLCFHPVRPPTDEQLMVVLSQVLFDVLALVRGRGLLAQSYDTDPLAETEPLLAACASASVQNLVALGPRAGKGLIRHGAEPLVKWAQDHVQSRGKLHVHRDGFDLHAAQLIHPNDRQQLERTLRYCARAPLSEERLELLTNGNALLRVKKAWSDGTTAIELQPLEFLQRLAALVVRPHINLLTYRGVLAPNHKMRSRVVAYGRKRRPAHASVNTGTASCAQLSLTNPVAQPKASSLPDLLSRPGQLWLAAHGLDCPSAPDGSSDGKARKANPTWASILKRELDHPIDCR